MKKTSRVMKPREEWIPIKIPAIIDETTFNLAQEQLKRNTAIAHRELKYEYLLRGLINCECGNNYAGNGQQRGHLYYRCTNRLKKFPLKKDCHNGSINAEKLEKKVWAGVVGIYSNKERLYDIAKNYFQSQQQPVISTKSTTPFSPCFIVTELSLLVEVAKLYSSIELRNLGGEVFPITTSPSFITDSGLIIPSSSRNL